MDFSLLTRPSNWCFPAFIYALLVGYTIIFTLVMDIKQKDGQLVSMKDKLMFALFELVSGIIVMYALLLLCKNGMDMVAWVILLLPIVVSVLTYKK
jgi:hypothetical protein